MKYAWEEGLGGETVRIQLCTVKGVIKYVVGDPAVTRKYVIIDVFNFGVARVSRYILMIEHFAQSTIDLRK
jgi:hypothetical protein